ncbi:TcfC E-set like domain-containing protein [Providencia rettgeri]|uniref:TcfC E-set like domain-containing protein n=1 Tax=Providencia TaxID=586 RepID=UPI002349E18E|nr:TcfC E-set like domain-containing protein [Providencia sp. PROV143]
MKAKVLFALILTPGITLGSNLLLPSNTMKIPSEFKQYFYNSEIISQVYLNDTPLFDAVFTLHENGQIHLLRILDEDAGIKPQVKSEWADILRSGISLGTCESSCPAGLVSAEYRLDNSALKLFTSHYEIEQVKSDYLYLPSTLPNGVIMHNNLSAVSVPSAKTWNFTSSIVSSYLGWTQKISLQTYGSSQTNQTQETNIYALYTQKELEGHFVRFGVFSPDSDKGNVETNGFSTGSVAGAMWGTSNALLINNESVSASPIYVTSANQATAEVWLDNRLIYSQQLQPGMQALDTRRLPSGVYDITINILENGKIVDTQTAQVYKPLGWRNPNQKWRVNFWGGQKRDLVISRKNTTENDNVFIGGGAVDYLLTPRVILGSSLLMTAAKYQLNARSTVTLSSDDSFFAQYTLTDDDSRKNSSVDLRYYRTLSPGNSLNVFWRRTSYDSYRSTDSSQQVGNAWGVSVFTQLPWASSLTLNGQYMKNPSREGVGIDAALTTKAILAHRDVNFRVSAYDRPGFNQKNREQGVTFGVSLSLMPSAKHTLSVDAGINDSNSYSSVNYQWQPHDEGTLRWLGAGISQSSGNTLMNGNGALESRALSGDVYVQHYVQGKSTTAGVNLSQTLLLGDGKLAASSGERGLGMDSAFIVDLESDDPDMQIVASDSVSETKLFQGRNVIPADVWKNESIQFYSMGTHNGKVFPEHESVQMNRGSVKYLKLKAVKTTVLVGMLQDKRGQMLKHRQVTSDISSGVINAEGVLTLDTGINNQKLTVLADGQLPALSCQLPDTLSPEKAVQFFPVIHCSPIGGV